MDSRIFPSSLVFVYCKDSKNYLTKIVQIKWEIKDHGKLLKKLSLKYGNKNSTKLKLLCSDNHKQIYPYVFIIINILEYNTSIN